MSSPRRTPSSSAYSPAGGSPSPSGIARAAISLSDLVLSPSASGSGAGAGAGAGAGLSRVRPKSPSIEQTNPLHKAPSSPSSSSSSPALPLPLPLFTARGDVESPQGSPNKRGKPQQPSEPVDSSSHHHQYATLERKNMVLETLARRHEETIGILQQQLLRSQQKNQEYEVLYVEMEPRFKAMKRSIESALSVLVPFLSMQAKPQVVDSYAAAAAAAATATASTTASRSKRHSTYAQQFFAASEKDGRNGSGVPDFESLTLAEIASRVVAHASSLADAVDSLSSANARLSDSCSAMSDREKTLGGTIAELENTCRALRDDVTGRSDRLRQMVSRDELDRVNKKLETVEAECKSVRAENSVLHGKCKGLTDINAQLSSMTDRYFDVLKKLGVAEEEKLALQKQLGKYKKQIHGISLASSQSPRSPRSPSASPASFS
eukprot:ANDGO_07702.mRNA.1 hypothetical protein